MWQCVYCWIWMTIYSIRHYVWSVASDCNTHTHTKHTQWDFQFMYEQSEKGRMINWHFDFCRHFLLLLLKWFEFAVTISRHNGGVLTRWLLWYMHADRYWMWLKSGPFGVHKYLVQLFVWMSVFLWTLYNALVMLNYYFHYKRIMSAIESNVVVCASSNKWSDCWLYSRGHYLINLFSMKLQLYC